MELYLLYWKSIVVRQCHHWQGVAHIVNQDLAFLSSYCQSERSVAFKPNRCDFLILSNSIRGYVNDFLLCIKVPELHLSIDSTHSSNIELRTIINAVKLRTLTNQGGVEAT